MMNWFGMANLVFRHPAWIWVIILQQVFMVLLIFRVVSGNWMGRETKKGE